MTREVFVLGTSHSLQCGAAECGAGRISLLEEEIQRVLSEYGIRRIAEEMSDDGLREKVLDEGRRTVCQRIAGDDVRVDFVDLGEEERASLSLSHGHIDAFMFKHTEETRERIRIRRCSAIFAGRCASASGWRASLPATSGPCSSCAVPITRSPFNSCLSGSGSRQPSSVVTSTLTVRG